MNIDKLLEEFQNGKFSKVYFLTGEEEAFKNEFLRSLKKKIIYPELNWENYYAEELDPSAFSHSLFSLPFLSQLKVIVVKNASALSSKIMVQLSEAANKIPSANCLILCDNEIPAQVERLIGKIGKLVYFGKLKRYQLKDWIVKRAQEDNKKINPEAVALLLENTNGNLSIISRELDKLISYTGEKKEIGLEDVESIGIDTKTYTIYQLVDKISEKKTTESLNILRNLLMSEISPQQIIGMLRWQFSKLWQTKALISNGTPSYKALEQAKVPFFKRNSFTAQMNNFKWEELKKCFNLILDTDIRIKRGAQADLSLELLLFRVTR